MGETPDLLNVVREVFFELVRKNFPGGVNPSSIIDRKKISRLFPQCLCAGLSDYFADKETILNLAKSECVPVGEKFYAIDSAAKEFFTHVFAQLQDQGINAVSYKRLFAKYDQQLRLFGISSPEILAGYIQSALSLPCAESFFRLNPAESIDSEIQNRLSNRDYVPYGELPALFLFIEEDLVVEVALRHGDFRKLKNEALFRASSLRFEEDEWQRELQKIRKNVRDNGFASLESLDLTQSYDKYPDLPEDAFRVALEEELDAANLYIKGPTIIERGSDNSLSGLIRQFCRKAKHFSIHDIESEFNVNLKTLNYLMDALQNNAIQIDQDNFVSTKGVYFDVAATDELIAELSQGQPATVLSFSSFSLFPAFSDYTWNHYLLQSFCIHASRVFSLVRPAPNNARIGIVFDKERYKNKKYYELAAIRALYDKVHPEQQSLAIYLKKNGFFERLRYSAVDGILALMIGVKKL